MWSEARLIMQKKRNNIRLPFDPKGDIFRWGPIPGKFLYVSTFTEVHYRYFRAKYGNSWPETFYLFKDGRMFWINDQEAIESVGRQVFLKFLLPKNKRNKIYKEWRRHTRELQTLQAKIDKFRLQTVSNFSLSRVWNKFHQIYVKFWVAGSVPELANYGSVALLEQKLQPVISNETKRAHALEVLTASTKLSFYQEEEIALLSTRKLIRHQKKYFWLKNSYASTRVLSINFFVQRKNQLRSRMKQKFEIQLSDTMKRKKGLQKDYKLSRKIMDIAEAISNGVAWQDERKKYIFIALHYEDLVLKEVAMRFGYNFDDLHLLWYFEVTQIIQGRDLHGLIKNRKSGFGVHFFHTCEELSSGQTDYVWRAYEGGAGLKRHRQLNGIIASKGESGKISKGRVHILLDPSKVKGFRKGEILVAPMTSPEYIFAMRKASAVVTDTGGLTSHAAIVSRELGIPCLVGTKIATKVLKDGDFVEVDANKGVVRRLSRGKGG